MSAEPGHVTSTAHDGWIELTIEHRGQRNALTPVMLGQIVDAVGDLVDRHAARVVLIRGAGGVFSSGYSLDALPNPENLAPIDDVERASRAIEGSTAVVVAALQGVCIGAALDLACACDLRIVHPDTLLGFTPARFGLVYNPGGLRRLCTAGGRDAARQLLYTAELALASSSLGRRFASVLAEGDLEPAAARLVASIARNAPRSLVGAKRTFAAIDAAGALDDDTAAAIHQLRVDALMSADLAEARRAFADRRPPLFTGG